MTVDIIGLHDFFRGFTIPVNVYERREIPTCAPDVAVEASLWRVTLECKDAVSDGDPPWSIGVPDNLRHRSGHVRRIPTRG